MVIMAVDPGLRGGVSFLTASGQILHYQPMPVRAALWGEESSKKMIDIAKVAAMIAKFQPTHCFVERVHAMPKQGVSSTFTFGTGYGMILGLTLSLEALLQTVLVQPRTWQRVMYAGLTGVDELEPKARAMAKAYQEWPTLAKGGVTHDGVIDSLLIAEYGRRSLALSS